jgi:hypothetical protein
LFHEVRRTIAVRQSNEGNIVRSVS